MNDSLDQDDVRLDIVPMFGNFLTDQFSHAVRVTHIPTRTVVYRSPFDFPEPKLRKELIERALEELQVKVERRLKKSKGQA